MREPVDDEDERRKDKAFGIESEFSSKETAAHYGFPR
jgi:hypothetical protein